jgi:HEAT repeat protein
MSAESDHSAKYRDDPRSTDELLALALSKDADLDDEGYWQPIGVLQHRLSQILERVRALGDSQDAKNRDTAATILGQCRVATKFSSGGCADVLLAMLARERSASVLPSIIFALGQLNDPRVVEPLVNLSTHQNARVRYAVVSTLGGHDDNLAIEAMVARSADQDSDVRNWATFGLGSMVDADTPAIRTALFARLEEEDDEIRGEAIVGLARRGDVRVTRSLLQELERLRIEVLREWSLILEAAEAVVRHANVSGSTEWRPVLEKLASCGIGNQAEIQAALNQHGSPQK